MNTTLVQRSLLCIAAFIIAVLIAVPVPAVYAQESVNGVYLPLVARESDNAQPGNDFSPAENTELAGGSHTFDSLTIPAGITVTMQGTATITIVGDARIAGTLLAECVALSVEAQGDLTITGTVDNRCVDPSHPDAEQADLHLATTGGTLQIGTADEQATIETSGNLEITNDPSLQEWEFAVLPDQRSSTSLPPVCSATASTLWLTNLPDDPEEVQLFADGADPDGGPVTFAWNFGDGSASATAPNPTHAYANTGAYAATVTVTDDDGQSCQASLQLIVGDEEGVPAPPALAVEPSDFVVPVGVALSLNAATVDGRGDELSYFWNFGDGATSTILTATHSYNTPGRYDISLTATDTETNSSQATTSVYVYEPMADDPVQSASQNAMQLVCPPNALPANGVVINANRIGGKAPLNKQGRDTRIRARGHLVIMPGITIAAQDGGDGENKNGVGTVRGRDGKAGGHLQVGVMGNLSLCAGVTLQAGDGGNGGNAIATAPPGRRAVARGGHGGPAASRLELKASGTVEFEGATTIDPGDGGRGGSATATGDPGRNRCNSAEEGAPASAYGGNGGKASKLATVNGRVVGIANATVTGGQGGDGGTATATGGNGGNATCPGTADGGDAGRAFAEGGNGGNATLTRAANAGFVVALDAFTAGDGGLATATGGQGGNGVATPPAACAPATATGGDGAKARALGGTGGRGRIDGSGSTGTANGGKGGDATATGGDCTNCQKGGDANATAGKGGDAEARAGRPLPAADTSVATAGHGGNATAKAGKGGDCAECPAGAGGEGGKAEATGGDGGDATGRAATTKTGGNGGIGDATGGQGGKGATCCTPPMQGGNGGKGGDAVSNAGRAGKPGGVDGANKDKGGNGGNGGDGNGPGAGGAGGPGTGNPIDIMDGLPGMGGNLCPVPPVTQTATPTDPIPDETPTPTVTPTTTPTPTIQPPVITGVQVRVATTQTTPSRLVGLAVTPLDENGEPFVVDSFFDVFVRIGGREVISDRVPTAGDGNGNYSAEFQFPAGAYTVDAIFVRQSDDTVVTGVSDQQIVFSAPILAEIAVLDLASAMPGTISGTGGLVTIIPRDQFGNAVPGLAPSDVSCNTDATSVQSGPVQPSASDPDFLAVALLGLEFGEGTLACTHPATGSSGSTPVVFMPAVMRLVNGQGEPGLGFPMDSFFDVQLSIQLPQNARPEAFVNGASGWQTANTRLTWPLDAPIQVQGCLSPNPIIQVICQPFSDPAAGVQHLNIQIQSETPIMEPISQVQVRLQTLPLSGLTPHDLQVELSQLALFNSVGEAIFENILLFGPEWRFIPIRIKPLKQLTVHIYRVDGAATEEQAQADVTQAQNAFNANGLLCTCPFYVAFSVKFTAVSADDWKKVDANGDGVDEAELAKAKDEGHFDNGAATVNVYYVPKVEGGDLGLTSGIGQAGVDNHKDHDGWTLMHELVHALDHAKDGDFDVKDSPDDAGNAQGARNPGNVMNYNKTGGFLTATQCNELGP